jgi:hypothetical protein
MAGNELPEEGPYRPVSKAYRKRFGYYYRRHTFDKLRAIDLSLREFHVLLGEGEVVAEADIGLLVHKELVLLVQWLRPLHVVIVVDEVREEERIVTVYEPNFRDWTDDFRRRR